MVTVNKHKMAPSSPDATKWHHRIFKNFLEGTPRPLPTRGRIPTSRALSPHAPSAHASLLVPVAPGTVMCSKFPEGNPAGAYK